MGSRCFHSVMKSSLGAIKIKIFLEFDVVVTPFRANDSVMLVMSFFLLILRECYKSQLDRTALNLIFDLTRPSESFGFHSPAEHQT